jgi:adenine phosphoribosyltransferase
MRYLGPIRDYIEFEVYKDFPNDGVMFLDLTPTYYNLKSRKFLVDNICSIIRNIDIDMDNLVIVAPEARGFILGSIIADRFNLPLILIRKENKFPPESIAVAKAYDTEYSKDCIAIQKYDLEGKDCIFIDDVFATGGTYNTTKELCELSGANKVIPIVVYDIKMHDEVENLYSIFDSENNKLT